MTASNQHSELIREALHSVHLVDDHGYVYSGPCPPALAALDSLEEQLETLREAVKWVLHTDVWIDDNPFHGPTLEPNGTTKTQVWDNLQAAYDAGSNPASSPKEA